MDGNGLDTLRIAAESAAILAQAPESAAARRRRDENVLWALRSHSAEAVAAAARISLDELAEIVNREARAQATPDRQASPLRFVRGTQERRDDGGGLPAAG